MSNNKREKNTLQKRIAMFIEKGKSKYGEKSYDYSLALKEYINNRTPVHIICNRCRSKPFLIYPFAHTSKGNNQKGTCPHCYVPKINVQKTRWNPNLKKRIKDFKKNVLKKYGRKYSFPFVEKEYINESSSITAVCNQCKSSFKRLARSFKSKSRHGGCEICNKKVMTEKIKVKNKKRQLRNHRTKNLPAKQGFIYKITNTKNGKFYIGYTNKTIKERLKGHFDESVKLSRGNRKAKSYLHNAMNHHGFEFFKIEVIEKHHNVSPYSMAKLEMKYIAELKPHYNVSVGGEIGRSKIHQKKAA